MRRRQLLAALATGLSVGVAGCNTTDDEGTPTTAPGTTSGASTPTATGPGDALEFESSGVDENNTARVPDRQAEAVVRNTSDQALANVTIRARWYNEEGHFLGNDEETLAVLPAGEAWSAWIYPYQVPTEDVASVDLSARYQGVWPGSTPGLDIVESELVEVDTADIETGHRMRGLVENGTGSEVTIRVFALLQRDDGTVLYGESARQSRVPAGDTWAWSINWGVLVRWSLVDDYTLYTQAT